MIERENHQPSARHAALMSSEGECLRISNQEHMALECHLGCPMARKSHDLPACFEHFPEDSQHWPTENPAPDAPHSHIVCYHFSANILNYLLFLQEFKVLSES